MAYENQKRPNNIFSTKGASLVSRALVWMMISVLSLTSCSFKTVKSTKSGENTNKDGSSGNANGASSAEETTASVDGESQGEKPPDIPSFRLSDPEAPKVVDAELEKIPTEINPLVEKWIAYFQGRGREHMERYLARSTRYEKLMKKVLRDNGLPDDLFYIALIESGFIGNARSHAAAVGYWQFIRGTGKRYGLTINAMVDERRDPVLATQAAADYFKGLYSAFGSWYLAMASYNVGENRVKRVVMKHTTRDFWELTAKKKALPGETINYIPKFIAARLIGSDPAKYGFEDIDYLPPIEYDHIQLEKPVNLRVMAEKLNYNYEDLKALNPKYKGEVAPLDGGKLELRVPPGSAEGALVAANESAVEKVEYIADTGDSTVYKIRRGESLHAIARKFRTTVAYLRDLNDIPRGRRLKTGMKIFVPDRSPVSDKRAVVKVEKKGSKANNMATATVAAPAESASAPVPSQSVSDADGTKYHIVQSGDSLYSIAQRYSVTVNKLKTVNNIRRGRLLKLGVKLRLPEDAQINDLKDGKNKPNAVGSGSLQKKSRGGIALRPSNGLSVKR